MHIVASAAKARTEIDSIADQPAVIDMFPIPVDSGKPRCRSQCCDFSALTEQHRSLQYDYHFDALVRQCSKCALDVIGTLTSTAVTFTPNCCPAASSSCNWGGAFGSLRLASTPTRAALGTISRASSICLAGKPST